MSRYDRFETRRKALSRRRAVIVGMPSTILFLLVAVNVDTGQPAIVLACAAVIGIITSFRLVHWLLRLGWPAFRAAQTELKQLENATGQLRRQLHALYASHPRREKGRQFKTTHALRGKSLHEFERAMAIGMRFEDREVFVTAFIRDDIVVRVTASVGTPSRCRAADDPRRWPDHYRRLECDRLRQYHNHPHYNNSTAPSRQDRKTAGTLERQLAPHGIALESCIVYWNPVGEWRLMRYDSGPRHWLEYEFDIAGREEPVQNVIS